MMCLVACKNNSKPSTGLKIKAPDQTKVDIKSTKKNNSVTITPYKLINDYTVTDTGYFDDVANAGTFAVIQKNGKLIDTIEKGFGMQRIDDNSFLYWTITDTGPLPKDVSRNQQYKNNISGSFGKYVLISGDKKQELVTMAIDFDNYFSSPGIINGKIYYWQIKQQKPNDLNKIFAAEYNPTSHSTKAYYLFDDDMGTDDVGYFPNPYLKNDTIYFDAGKYKLMKFSKTFQSYN